MWWKWHKKKKFQIYIYTRPGNVCAKLLDRNCISLKWLWTLQKTLCHTPSALRQNVSLCILEKLIHLVKLQIWFKVGLVYIRLKPKIKQIFKSMSGDRCSPIFNTSKLSAGRHSHCHTVPPLPPEPWDSARRWGIPGVDPGPFCWPPGPAQPVV